MKGISKVLIPLILSLSLLLSGCAGTGAETPDTLDEDTVALVNGEAISYGEFAEQMASVEALYSSLSASLSEAEIKEKLQTEAENVLETLIRQTILRQKIAEYNLTLTDAEEQEAQAAWTAVREKIAASVARNYPDYSGEDLDALVQIAIEGSSLQEDTVVQSARQQLLLKKLEEALTADLPPIADSAVEARYQELLAEQQSQFDADAAAFESAMLSKATVVYIPHPYRVLQELDLRFDDDMLSMLAQLKEYDTEDDDTYETMLSSERSLLQEKAQTLRGRLGGGERFEDLMAEYGGRVNYISEATTRFSQAYRDAALSIESVGGTADTLVETDSGGTLLRWAGTLDPGPVPLEEAAEDIRAEMLAESRSAAWSAQQSRWREEAEVVIHEELISYQ